MSSDVAVSPGRLDRRQARRIRYFVPVAVFVAVAAMFAWVQGRTLGLASENLYGEVSLVNVFASWCVECRLEHPLIMQMKAQGVVTIHGLNYKDRPDDAARWLNSLGDPYTRTGADINGRVGIDWGVYGVPETFVIGKDGRIAYKHIGPLSAEVLEKKIIPLIETLKQQPSPRFEPAEGAASPLRQVNQ
jgi:cytochrome c biogenesis protein CcmG/thiol:disulfide interchange protein DsbE